MFLAILKRKCLLQGGDVITADTKVVRASQYDHVTDSYKKVPLSCRIKTVGGGTGCRGTCTADSS